MLIDFVFIIGVFIYLLIVYAILDFIYRSEFNSTYLIVIVPLIYIIFYFLSAFWFKNRGLKVTDNPWYSNWIVFSDYIANLYDSKES